MKRLGLLFLFVPMLVFGQTNIYRSVQPDADNNSATIFTSGASVTLTISGTTATFSSGAPDTVGVGNVIQYDSSNAGAVNAVCFISGRTSSTVFTVQRFQGGTPASCSGDTDWSVFHPYTKINNCINGTENTGIAAGVRNFDGGHRNIDTASEIWNIACYRGVDSTDVSQDLDNFTTSATEYIKIYTPTASNEVGVTQRHTGKRIINCYKLIAHNTGAGASTLRVNASATDNIFHIRIEGLFIKCSGSSAVDAIDLQDMGSGTDARVTNCIIEGSDSISTQSGFHNGIWFQVSNAAASNPVFIAANNVIYNFKTSAATTNENGIYLNSTSGSTNLYCYNNTVYKCENGYLRNGGQFYAKNCIAQRSGTNQGYTNAFNAASTNNQSDYAADAPGSNPITGTVKFAEAAANKNYLLHVTDTVAKGAGMDLRADAAFPISTDILGGSRPQGANFDLGAHEFTPASVLVTQKRKYIQ